MPRKKTTIKQPSTGVLALQWLTYALWACLAIVSLVSTSLVVSYFINEQVPSVNETVYLLTAMAILLVVSTAVDSIYSKNEDTKKKKSFNLVTTVHTVLFTLALVISLIAAAFNLVNQFIDYGLELSSTKVALTVSIVAVLLSAALVARTTLALKPNLARQASRWTFILIPVVLTAITVFAILPKSITNQRDSLVEMALMDINFRINEHVDENNNLPEDLNKLDLEQRNQKILDDKLISYKPNTRDSDNGRYYYELCGTYTLNKLTNSKNSYQYGNDAKQSFGHHRNTDFTLHSDGEYCYKLYSDKNDSLYKSGSIY